MKLLEAISEFVFDPVPTVDSARPLVREPDRRTVMIIDDDTALLDTVQLILQEAGYNVLKTDRGVKGLEVLDCIPRDERLILLDFQMPDLDGEGTFQLWRSNQPRVGVFRSQVFDPNNSMWSISTASAKLSMNRSATRSGVKLWNRWAWSTRRRYQAIQDMSIQKIAGVLGSL